MCIRDRSEKETTCNVRATSKKRAAEAEKDINMEDKEATPVEDVEMTLPPAELKQPAQPKEQPEMPTQTGDVNVPEKDMEKSKTMEDSKMDKIMEMFLQMSKQMEETSKKMENKMDSTQEEIKSTKAVSYTHLDVYKRQTINRTGR